MVIAEEEWKEMEKILIGRGEAKEYLWNFYIKTQNFEDLGLQYNPRYEGTVKMITDNLTNIGWEQDGESWNAKIKTQNRHKVDEKGNPVYLTDESGKLVYTKPSGGQRIRVVLPQKEWKEYDLYVVRVIIRKLGAIRGMS